MNLLTLRLFSLGRMIKENVVAWGALGAVYSITATLLFQPIQKRLFGIEFENLVLWSLITFSVLVPLFFEFLPFGSLSRWGSFFAKMIGRLFSKNEETMGRIYAQHELRRSVTWLVIILTSVVGAVVANDNRALWLLFAQANLQRALYSVHNWRMIAIHQAGSDRAVWFVGSIMKTQAFIAFISSALFLGFQFRFDLEALTILLASVTSVLIGASICLEGDSGRPLLINFLSLSMGSIGGMLTLYHPAMSLIGIYFAYAMRAQAKNRFKSVENMNEDTLIP